MKILVTGASGFVGQHLLARLSCREVIGTTHRVPSEKLVTQFPGVEFRALDILREEAVQTLVRETRPQVCFHLAGIASVDVFDKSPRECFNVNTQGWLNLLEAFKKEAPGATLVLISSAQVYGTVDPSRLPVTEASPVAPENFYSISKVSSEWLARNYSQNYAMRVIVLRPFNHIGPGQSTSFVCSSFAKQIAQIEAGLCDPVIHVGNLAKARDFTDVRDIVKAYVFAMDKCEDVRPYNICSGKATAIREILERLIASSGLRVRIEIETTRKRDMDPEVVFGSAERFCKATGWAPEIPLEKTLRDTLEYWRKQVPSKGASSRVRL